MDNINISIRNLKPDDIPVAMELVLAEGWNQTEKDWKLFLSHPGNVCKCAEIDGKLIGTTTSYNFSNKVAWISMVLVKKDFRGRGISKMLLNSVLNELKNCKSIKLDATPAGRNVYRQLGFVNEYRISRMVNNSSDYSNTFDIKSALEIDKRDLVEIVEFDGRVFGAPREQLIKAWYLDHSQGSYMIKQNDQIKGFALGRNGNRFLQIGPVSANSMSDTKILMSRALLNHTGKPVVVDVLNDKTDFVHWLTALGFEKKREFTRMFLKSNLYSREKHKQYLIGGPEFG